MNTGYAVFNGFIFFLVFGSIIFLAVVTTRFIGGKAGKAMKGKHIHVVETVSLGMDKQIYLLKAGEEFILVACSGKNITYLTKLKDNSVEIEEEIDSVPAFNFKSMLDKYVNHFKGGKKQDMNGLIGQDVGEALKGDVFKNNLNRIKNYSSRLDIQVKNSEDDFTND